MVQWYTVQAVHPSRDIRSPPFWIWEVPPHVKTILPGYFDLLLNLGQE